MKLAILSRPSLLLILLVSPITLAEWHIPQSMVRYRIEPDLTRARIPDIFTIDLEPITPNPARLRLHTSKPENNYLWTGRRLFSKGEPLVWPGAVEFKLSSAFEYFVAQVGVDDRTDYCDHVVFKVYIDGKMLYQSPGQYRGAEPIAINLRIPPNSKTIRLQTEGPNIRRKLAIWGNAGFTLRGRSPLVSQVFLYPAGFNYQQYEPVVTTTAGQVLGCKLIHNAPGEPMSILFDSSRGLLACYVYLVRKGSAPQSSWKPHAGLTLATRRAATIDKKCHNMKGLGELWLQGSSPVNTSPIGLIHHGSPPHGILMSHYEKKPRDALGLYYYEGFFKTEKTGTYTFATASNWGSYLSVDGTLVVEWPGGHSWHGGRRGEKQGAVILNPGIHRLEYLNCSPWTTMLTLAAWQGPDPTHKPGQHLRIMTDADFLPMGYYCPVSVNYTKSYGSMTWNTISDLRSEQNGIPLVMMAFDYLPSETRKVGSCHWHFDDNTSAIGNSVRHIFFQPGLRQVKLEILDNNNSVLATIEQQAAVTPRWDRVWYGPELLNEYQQTILKNDLNQTALADLAALYIRADDLNMTLVKTQSAQALAQRAEQLCSNEQYGELALNLADYLTHWQLRDYDAAYHVYDSLAQLPHSRNKWQPYAIIGLARILLRIQNNPERALQELNLLGSTRKLEPRSIIEAELLRAEARFLTDQPQLAAMIIERANNQPPAAAVNIRHQALLRSSIHNVETLKPDDLDSVQNNLDLILTENPSRLTDSELLLARIDLHLKRNEDQLAAYYCNLANHLDLSEIDRPEFLLRHIQACQNMKNIKQAQRLFNELQEQYPYSPAVPQARLLLNRSQTMK